MTYYNVNRHFNPTNVCYADCKFCGFFRTPRQPDAYTHNIEDSLRIAGEAVKEGATELHIVGGLNTKLPFSYFTDLLSSLKAKYPQLHLKAWTMVELDHFARFYKMSDEEVISKLREAGMDSCPGGGAEIFREPTRSMICAHKTDARALARPLGQGARGGAEDERDDALRPHRINRRPRRSLRPAARAAGQVGRLPVLHPARLLPAGLAARAPAGAVGR